MLYQIHHQFKDGHTEMLVQAEFKSNEEFIKLVRETSEKYSCPKNAQFLFCDEKSELFLWITTEEELLKRENKSIMNEKPF